MSLAQWGNLARAAIQNFGDFPGCATQIWMHPDDWNDLRAAYGPPLEVVEQQFCEWVAYMQRRDPAFVAPPKQVFRDGDRVGQFQFCSIHIDSKLTRGMAHVRSEPRPPVDLLPGFHIRVIDSSFPIGPFEPAVEPKGGWGQMLFLPPS